MIWEIQKQMDKKTDILREGYPLNLMLNFKGFQRFMLLVEFIWEYYYRRDIT